MTTTNLLRTCSAFAAAGLLGGMLSACSPEETPTPEPAESSAFATDEEAFAAAEETYRAYVAAQNQIDLTDPRTFEPLYSLTVGDAHSAVRESLTQLHADQVTMTGKSTIASAKPLKADLSSGTISMHVCVDVSGTDLLDADGVSLVPPTRADIQSLLVNFAASPGREIKVSRTTGDETPCQP